MNLTGFNLSIDELANIIDHTLLKADARKEDFKRLCEEAKRYKFKMIAVNSGVVSMCKTLLKGSQVHVGATISFPLGQCTIETKVYETINAIENGADEIDMVINVGALKSKEHDVVREDIKAVVNGAGSKATVKVIIETCLLTDEEKVIACKLAREAGADFVKTSTGFSTGGATVKDVKLMKDTIGDDLQIKASGGIRDYEVAKAMVESGASRIGASASIKIVKGEK